MKLLGFIFFLCAISACSQTSDQIQSKSHEFSSIEEEIVALSKDPVYIQYNVNKLLHTNSFDQSPYDKEELRSVLASLQATNTEDICSDESLKKFETIQGGGEMQRFFCEQRKLLNQLRERYPTVANDAELMKKTYRYLVENSAEFAREFKKIKGIAIK